jgi:DNA excision repair protein ERCC-4
MHFSPEASTVLTTSRCKCRPPPLPLRIMDASGNADNVAHATEGDPAATAAENLGASPAPGEDGDDGGSTRTDPGETGEVHLLSYERELLSQLLDEDALVVMASGLGWHKVVAVLLRLAQHAAQQHEARGAQASAGQPQQASDTSGCVLVLGAFPWQRALVCSELARHDPHLPPPLDINNEVPALERIRLYRAPGGRPLFVTPRIITVDLLARRLTGAEIAGMIVLNAHRTSDTSGEGFAAALYRDTAAAGGAGAAARRRGWLRAFSDQPTAFSHGFNKVGACVRHAGDGAHACPMRVQYLCKTVCG